MILDGMPEIEEALNELKKDLKNPDAIPEEEFDAAYDAFTIKALYNAFNGPGEISKVMPVVVDVTQLKHLKWLEHICKLYKKKYNQSITYYYEKNRPGVPLFKLKRKSAISQFFKNIFS